jgi:hypothetical protein
MNLFVFASKFLGATPAIVATGLADIKNLAMQAAQPVPVLTTIATEASSADDGMGNPIILVGLLLVLLVLVAIGAAALAFTGFLVGSVFAVLITLVVWGLINLQVLSAVSLTSWHNRLTAPRFKTFVLSTSAIAGLVTGGLVAGVLNRILHWMAAPAAVAGGMVSGLLPGIAFGFGAYYLLCRLTRR